MPVIDKANNWLLFYCFVFLFFTYSFVSVMFCRMAEQPAGSASGQVEEKGQQYDDTAIQNKLKQVNHLYGSYQGGGGRGKAVRGPFGVTPVFLSLVIALLCAGIVGTNVFALL